MQVIYYPHPTLRHKSKPLKRVDRELKSIVGRMFELMYESSGIGLAANQVDLPYRLFVINLTADPEAKDEEMVFINPVIVRRFGGMAEAEEGCLSLPGVNANVRRPAEVVVSAFNLSGDPVNIQGKGLFARAVQHENDHLDGTLFIDRLDESEYERISPALAALENSFAADRGRGAVPDDQAIARRLAELESART